MRRCDVIRSILKYPQDKDRKIDFITWALTPTAQDPDARGNYYTNGQGTSTERRNKENYFTSSHKRCTAHCVVPRQIVVVSTRNSCASTQFRQSWGPKRGRDGRGLTSYGPRSTADGPVFHAKRYADGYAARPVGAQPYDPLGQGRTVGTAGSQLTLAPRTAHRD